ncbi:MAG: 50S ribosomal protein L18e [Thermoplasmataceae archaeon]
MSLRAQRKTSPALKTAVDELGTISRENASDLWRDIAFRLTNPRRNMSQVNLGKISKIASDGETVLIPGKVLGNGYFDKKVTIAAMYASENAIKKIKESGSTFLTLKELALENPKGKGIRIVG